MEEEERGRDGGREKGEGGKSVRERQTDRHLSVFCVVRCWSFLVLTWRLSVVE